MNTIWLLHFYVLFLDAYFSEGVLLRDCGDADSPYLLLSPDIYWDLGPSIMRVPSYKNRGKIGESVQLPCNLVNSPFLLTSSSLAPRSSSLNHGGGEASKGGDDGAGPRHDQAGSSRREPGGKAAAVVPLRCGDDTHCSQSGDDRG